LVDENQVKVRSNLIRILSRLGGDLPFTKRYSAWLLTLNGIQAKVRFCLGMPLLAIRLVRFYSAELFAIRNRFARQSGGHSLSKPILEISQ